MPVDPRSQLGGGGHGGWIEQAHDTRIGLKLGKHVVEKKLRRTGGSRVLDRLILDWFVDGLGRLDRDETAHRELTILWSYHSQESVCPAKGGNPRRRDHRQPDG